MLPDDPDSKVNACVDNVYRIWEGHADTKATQLLLANAGMNPKALQYIMGHANITMTLNYYAHATYDSAKAEMERLAA